MKANELRIGNWVEASVQFQIDAKFIYEYSVVGGDYKPIPLTEKWLVKFGFDKDGKMKGTGFLFRICFDEKAPYAYLETYGGGEYKIEIEYIHQLQNLYFALTGEELTIKAQHEQRETKRGI